MLYRGANPGDGKPEPSAEIVPVDVPLSDLEVILKDKTLQYRCERLLQAGLTIAQARALTLDPAVDIHFVTERLVARGCPPHLAFDIAS